MNHLYSPSAPRLQSQRENVRLAILFLGNGLDVACKRKKSLEDLLYLASTIAQDLLYLLAFSTRDKYSFIPDSLPYVVPCRKTQSRWQAIVDGISAPLSRIWPRGTGCPQLERLKKPWLACAASHVSAAAVLAKMGQICWERHDLSSALARTCEELLGFRFRRARRTVALINTRRHRQIWVCCSTMRGDAHRLVVVRRGYLYLENDRRNPRSVGTYPTPDSVVEWMVEDLFRSLKPLFRRGRTISVLDGSVEGGRFLVEASRVANVHRQMSGLFAYLQIFGVDRDPTAHHLARLALRYACARDRADTRVNLLCADTLLDPLRHGENGELWTNFDGVIGNPPWDARLSKPETCKLRQRFRSVLEGRFDKFFCFIKRIHELLSPTGVATLVVPTTLLFNRNARKLRAFMLNNFHIQRIAILPPGIFREGNNIVPVIVSLRKSARPSPTAITKLILLDTQASPIGEKHSLSQNRWHNHPDYAFQIQLTSSLASLWDRIAMNSIPLGSLGWFHQGIKIRERKNTNSVSTKRGKIVCLRARNVGRYFLSVVGVERLCNNRHLHRRVPDSFLVAEKIFFQGIRNLYLGRRLVGCLGGENHCGISGCYMFVPKNRFVDIRYLLAVFNSRLMNVWYGTQDWSLHIRFDVLRRMPIQLCRPSKQNAVVGMVDRLRRTIREKERLRALLHAGSIAGDAGGKSQLQQEIAMHERLSEEIDLRIEQTVQEIYGLTEGERNQLMAKSGSSLTDLKYGSCNAES